MKLEEIKELVLLFDSAQTTKLHLQRGDFVLKLEKGHSAKAEPQTIMVQAPLVKDNDDEITPLPKKEGDTITSPMVGTFYRSPSPGSAAYVCWRQGQKRTNTCNYRGDENYERNRSRI